MIEIYREEDKHLIKETIEDFNESTPLDEMTWINIPEPNQELLELVADKTGIPTHFLLASLDDEESARIDNEDGSVLIVLDVPCATAESNTYITQPFIVAYNDKYYVTIDRYKSTLLQDMLNPKSKANVEPQKQVRLTLNIIYQMSKEFISYLRKIDSHSKDIETRLHSSMKNKELFELMNINKTLVYFATSLSSNKAVLMKLLKSAAYVKYDADKDLMEDAEVEINQAIEMCSIYREILSGLMDAYGTIVSNNLNIVMKTLSIITIVISIITLVASIYGMNVDLPFSNKPWSFYLIITVAIIAAIISAVLLYFSTRHNKTKD